MYVLLHDDPNQNLGIQIALWHRTLVNAKHVIVIGCDEYRSLNFCITGFFVVLVDPITFSHQIQIEYHFVKNFSRSSYSIVANHILMHFCAAQILCTRILN